MRRAPKTAGEAEQDFTFALCPLRPGFLERHSPMPPLSHLKHHRSRLALTIGMTTGDWTKHDQLVLDEYAETEKRIADAATEPMGEAEVDRGLGGSGVDPPNE